MPKFSKETHTRLIREVNQTQIRLNLQIALKGIKGLSIKIVFLEYKVPKLSKESHTILIREVKQAQL